VDGATESGGNLPDEAFGAMRAHFRSSGQTVRQMSRLILGQVCPKINEPPVSNPVADIRWVQQRSNNFRITSAFGHSVSLPSTVRIASRHAIVSNGCNTGSDGAA
jgi:hypothetical protein